MAWGAGGLACKRRRPKACGQAHDAPTTLVKHKQTQTNGTERTEGVKQNTCMNVKWKGKAILRRKDAPPLDNGAKRNEISI
jgi:hypothetical protein